MSEESKVELPANFVRLLNPVADFYGAFILGNAQYCDRVVEQDSHKGKTLVICGAGPSLKEEADKYCNADHVVWGCNSAGPWLLDNGYRCDVFFSVDQTPELIGEWVSAPDVDYYLASTAHPNLTDYLLSKDRRISWFHNFVGINKPPVAYSVCADCDHIGDHRAEECQNCKSTLLDRGIMQYEDWLYMSLYPGTVRAGSGLNTVSRAIDVALFMGFDKIYVLGADCWLRTKRPRAEHEKFGTPEYEKYLREETTMHANGGSALANNQSPLTADAWIDPGTKDERIRKGKGKFVLTKIDLLATAIFLVEMERQLKPRVQLVGDTFPALLRKKNKAFLMRLYSFIGNDGKKHSIEYQGAA